jgi:hypothetical protein
MPAPKAPAAEPAAPAPKRFRVRLAEPGADHPEHLIAAADRYEAAAAFKAMAGIISTIHEISVTEAD